MPPRVVTVDIEAMLGIEILAVVPVPYREDLPIPAPLQGGKFVDILAIIPPGIQDASELNTHVYEAMQSAPARLKRLNDGAMHEIWGWPKRNVPLNPATPEDAEVIAGSRVQCLLYDLGDKLGWRVDDARPLPRGDGRVVAELLVDSPGASANRPADHIFDTLDSHPSELRAVVERSPWVRRETAADTPPGWNERKPFP